MRLAQKETSTHLEPRIIDVKENMVAVISAKDTTDYLPAHHHTKTYRFSTYQQDNKNT